MHANVATMLFVIVGVGVSTAQIPDFSVCGTLVEQDGCIVLRGENDRVYALDDVQGKTARARVAIRGVLDPSCNSGCAPDGCIAIESIESRRYFCDDHPFSGCGQVSHTNATADADVEWLLAADDGRTYGLLTGYADLSTLNDGDIVFVVGSLHGTIDKRHYAYRLGPQTIMAWDECPAVDRTIRGCARLWYGDECFDGIYLDEDGAYETDANRSEFCAGEHVYVEGRIEPSTTASVCPDLETAHFTISMITICPEDSDSPRSCPDFEFEGCGVLVYGDSDPNDLDGIREDPSYYFFKADDGREFWIGWWWRLPDHAVGDRMYFKGRVRVTSTDDDGWGSPVLPLIWNVDRLDSAAEGECPDLPADDGDPVTPTISCPLVATTALLVVAIALGTVRRR